MKKRVFFLVPYPVGKAPSQRFRFEQYFKALSKEDIDYQVQSFMTDKGWETIYSNKRTLMIWYLYVGVLRRIIHLFFVFKYDYVFIHREAAPIGPPVFEWIVAKIFGKKIIYDFDDAIWLYDNNERRNIGTRLKWKSKVAKICSWSWKIVVGNDFLKDFAVQYNSNIIVVPTVVDTKYYHNPDLHKKVRANEITIGWTGTHSTLQYLNSISPLLSKLQKIPNVRILIIANQKPSFSFNFDFRFWKQDTEIEDLMEVDIGVMPLTKDTWSQGKGG